MRKSLGTRLKHVRASRTQPEMAGVLGVAGRTYANYERDERLPDADALQKLVGHIKNELVVEKEIFA